MFERRGIKMEKPRRRDTFYIVLNRWMFLKHKGENIGDYLCARNIRRIAIYGMGDMARHLWDELKNTKCEVVAVIDSEEKYYYDDIKTITIENFKENVDMIVYIDPLEPVNMIEELKVKCQNVCSLEDVVFYAF
jgi:FlaA1/EpsC-like NDP-sugar epimerase